MDHDKSFPTMIIPNGTEITVNEHGQLSIRTPGNLVIQNSAVYSVIESTAGSVRIDPDVKVEAVSVRAAEACYIAGSLTAWRVAASKIILEKNAQAFVMLQEADALELDRSARLVGNFQTEKELYLMLGRFNRQLRELPEALEPGEDQRRPQLNEVLSQRSPLVDDEPFAATTTRQASSSGQKEDADGAKWQELQRLLQVERDRPGRPHPAREAISRLMDLAAQRQRKELAEVADYLLSRLPEPSPEQEQIREIVNQLGA